MSEFVMTGRYANGQPIYVEELNEAEITAKVEASKEWKQFSETFIQNDATDYLWRMAQIDKLGVVDSGVDNRLKLLRDILRSGGIISLRTIKSATGKVLLDGGSYEFELKPEPPVVEEPPPVHRGQQLWSEYRQFSESHSIQDCRNRAKVDAGFASFMRKNYEREARETESTQFPLAGLFRYQAGSAVFGGNHLDHPPPDRE